MTKKHLLLVVVSVCLVSLDAQERLELTDPIAKASTQHYRVTVLTLDRDNERVLIRLVANNGDRFEHLYEGTTAVTLMRALNTANLSVRSLNHRILDRLIADGVLVGTATGTPQ